MSKADGEGEAEADADSEAAPPMRRPETPAVLAAAAGDASDTAGDTESEAEVSCAALIRSGWDQAVIGLGSGWDRAEIRLRAS